MSASVVVRAPSNIALIKYMGKKDSARNLPENDSISLTLDSLSTVLELVPSENWKWVPEAPRAQTELKLLVPSLNDSGVDRFVRHAQKVQTATSAILKKFEMEMGSQERGAFEIRAANTFPASAGIASSASSFAALSLAVVASAARDPEAFRSAWGKNVELRRAVADISRQGSGSSCRSFEGPWVFWGDEHSRQIPSALGELAHFVIVISTASKSVSSSEAHSRVKTSPLWSGRPERVARRIEMTKSALEKGDFRVLSRMAWTEAWEMHSLFHTSAEPFTYWEPATIDALHWLAPEIAAPAPPIASLDAGPNIHVIVPARAKKQWREKLVDKFGEGKILEDRAGHGAEIL